MLQSEYLQFADFKAENCTVKTGKVLNFWNWNVDILTLWFWTSIATLPVVIFVLLNLSHAWLFLNACFLGQYSQIRFLVFQIVCQSQLMIPTVIRLVKICYLLELDDLEILSLNGQLIIKIDCMLIKLTITAYIVFSCIYPACIALVFVHSFFLQCSKKRSGTRERPGMWLGRVG